MGCEFADQVIPELSVQHRLIIIDYVNQGVLNVSFAEQ